MPLPEFNALILDLEVVPEKEGQAARIIKVGAMRSDRSTTLEMNTPNARELQSALERLDALAQDARCVVGHNILAHDLPLLRAAAPSLRLLHLPVIDTLRLSPLAFPQNPYHRLVKDYKIISGSLNSPLADCRATLTLLQDQHGAFTRLAAQRPAELVCYQALIAQQPGAGLGDWMQGITGQAPVSVQMLGNALSALVRETDPVLERDLKVCSTRLQSLISTDLAGC